MASDKKYDVTVTVRTQFLPDQSDATRAHRPEVCYPAQGFEIVSDGQGLVPTAAGALRVRRLVARAGGQRSCLRGGDACGGHVRSSRF